MVASLRWGSGNDIGERSVVRLLASDVLVGRRKSLQSRDAAPRLRSSKRIRCGRRVRRTSVG